MRKGYRRKYDWNLFGKHCGLNIIGRLDYINGKPMVYVALLNVLLLIVNKCFVDVPEVSVLVSHWGWGVLNVLAKIAFWVLFIDGVIVNFLWCFTRGKYSCSYFVLLYESPNVSNRRRLKRIKDDLAWAWFLFRHPEFDYELQRVKNEYTINKVMAGEALDPAGYDRDMKALFDKYAVHKDTEGRYYSLNDRKYRKLLKEL